LLTEELCELNIHASSWYFSISVVMKWDFVPAYIQATIRFTGGTLSLPAR